MSDDLIKKAFDEYHERSKRIEEEKIKRVMKLKDFNDFWENWKKENAELFEEDRHRHVKEDRK